MEQYDLCVKEIDELKPYVKKSNAFARARWGPQSVLELRLVAILASKINKEANVFIPYSIHLSELFGKKYGGRDIQKLEKIAKAMMERVITIRDEKGSWEMCHVMRGCKYDAENNILTMVFHEDLKRHVLKLQKLFTRYSLEDFIKLSSVYSQRLYEFLQSWKDHAEIVWDLSDLHDMLETPESQRRDFRQFRTRVLEKAQDDLRKIDFYFDWEPIRKGRQVEKIRFVVWGSKLDRDKKEEDARGQKEQEEARAIQARILSVSCYARRGEACQGGFQNQIVCDQCLKARKPRINHRQNHKKSIM